jgi:hypothetical protein
MFLDKAWSRPPRPLPRLQTNLSLAVALAAVRQPRRGFAFGLLFARFARFEIRSRRRVSNAIVRDFRKRISSIRRSSLSSIISSWISITPIGMFTVIDAIFLLPRDVAQHCANSASR